MRGRSVPPELTVIETTWISESAIGEDFVAVFRPLDGLVRGDMTVFALHSMGWIQVETFSGVVSVTFDSRSVQEPALKNLVDYLIASGDSGRTRLFRFGIYNGRPWFRQTSTGLVPVIEVLLQVTEFGPAEIGRASCRERVCQAVWIRVG